MSLTNELNPFDIMMVETLVEIPPVDDIYISNTSNLINYVEEYAIKIVTAIKSSTHLTFAMAIRAVSSVIENPTQQLFSNSSPTTFINLFNFIIS